MLESVQSMNESITYDMCKSKDGPLGTRLAGPIAMLKFQTTRMAWDVADHCVQIMGGRGITRTGMGAKVEGFKNCKEVVSPLKPRSLSTPPSGVLSLQHTPRTLHPHQRGSVGFRVNLRRFSVVLRFFLNRRQVRRRLRWIRRDHGRPHHQAGAQELPDERPAVVLSRRLRGGTPATEQQLPYATPIELFWRPPFNHKHHKPLNNTTTGVVRACRPTASA